MSGELHRRIFALLTQQGTACAETGLCEDHDSSAARDSVEREARRNAIPDSDPIAPGSWTDCGRNPEMGCRVCGTNGSDPRSRK